VVKTVTAARDTGEVRYISLLHTDKQTTILTLAQDLMAPDPGAQAAGAPGATGRPSPTGAARPGPLGGAAARVLRPTGLAGRLGPGALLRRGPRGQHALRARRRRA
jgi:hypothetical protein